MKLIYVPIQGLQNSYTPPLFIHIVNMEHFHRNAATASTGLSVKVRPLLSSKSD